MRNYLLIVLTLLLGSCASVFGECPDGQPPQTISNPYMQTINGTTTDATGQLGAEMRSGNKTILTLQTDDGVRLELTLYRDPAVGEKFAVDTSASYQSERDAGAWLGGKNADNSLIGGGRGGVTITGRSTDGISGEFEVTYFNANMPPVTIKATFEDAPLAICR
jgi:hypothetical protein